MDAATLDSVYTTVRLIAPQLMKISDDDIKHYIALAEPHISERRFGPYYVEALSNYVAHMLTVQGIIAAEGAESATLTSGGIIGEREGDLQRTYGDVAVNDASLFSKTAYGKRYHDLLKMCIVPICTRMGGLHG